ncbi:Imm44 family immunity protein [Flavobacterium zepuense]|nr:Imm44 family immunity protein [Flavobacterium zepuense]
MDDNIIGCFISSNIGDEHGPIFRQYIWSDNGIGNALKNLKYYNYGKDIKLILLQFYVNPIPYLKENLKEVEEYRKREKSIGLSIVIDQDNFFSKDETHKFLFLKDEIISRIIQLQKINLDTNIEILINDLLDIFESFLNS